MLDNVLLTGLPEGQPVDRECVAEALEAIELAAEREGENVPLNLGAVFERVDPVGDELRVRLEPVLACEPERSCPRIPSIGERAGAVLQRHVLADGVAFVAVDPT